MSGLDLLGGLNRAVLLFVLLSASVSDLKRNTIPNRLLLSALGVRLVLFVAELQAGSWDLRRFREDLLVLCLWAVFSAADIFLLKKAIGMGDLKLMAVMELFLGSRLFEAALLSSLFLAGLGCGLLLAFGQRERRDKIPLAPFFLSGTLLSLLLSG